MLIQKKFTNFKLVTFKFDDEIEYCFEIFKDGPLTAIYHNKIKETDFLVPLDNFTSKTLKLVKTILI